MDIKVVLEGHMKAAAGSKCSAAGRGGGMGEDTHLFQLLPRFPVSS